MTVETLSELIETQKLQTTTIKELLEICGILKDRIEALEEDKKKYVCVTNNVLHSSEFMHLPIKIENDKIHDIDSIGKEGI